jgi:hypothetical protein
MGRLFVVAWFGTIYTANKVGSIEIAVLFVMAGFMGILVLGLAGLLK